MQKLRKMSASDAQHAAAATSSARMVKAKRAHETSQGSRSTRPRTACRSSASIRIPAVPLSACSPLIRRLGGDTPRRARRTRDGVDSQGPQSPASTVAARCLAAHRRRLLFGKRAGPKPLTYRTGVGGGLGALHPGHDDRSGLGLVRASLLLEHDVDRRVGCKSAAGQADACCRS